MGRKIDIVMYDEEGDYKTPVKMSLDKDMLEQDSNDADLRGGFRPKMHTGLSGAGSTQGDATAIDPGVNVFSSVSAGQGAVLKAPTKQNGSTAGVSVTVRNNGANALAVYPQSGASIDGQSADASVSVSNGSSATFYSDASGNWWQV